MRVPARLEIALSITAYIAGIVGVGLGARLILQAIGPHPGLCYGYRMVKSLPVAPSRRANEKSSRGEAAIVDRIFREYVAGIAPKAIAKRLNQDKIADRSTGPGVQAPSTATRNVVRAS